MSLSAQVIPERASGGATRSTCSACGAQVIAKGVEVPDYEYGLSHLARYVECGACGALFQEPMPTLRELAGFYPPDYHSMTHAGLLSKIRNDLRIARLAKLVAGNGAILDYGCGDGTFLLQAAERMPSRLFWGFEIADHTEKIVLSGGAVTIVKGTLPDLLALLPACSLITLNHVIEHLPEPFATVKALVEQLLPGGAFEGQTPSADSLEHAVFGRRWSGYHAPRHTVVFSRAGLCRLLERCGLTSPTVEGAFNPAGLAVSLASTLHSGAGRIKRSGVHWLFFLALAGLLAPIDLLSGRPGIINFVAHKSMG